MTSQDILNIRLAQQGFIKKFKTAEEAVKVLGAVQAQEFQGGMWGIGLRMGDITEEKIEKEVNAGKIIRTWPMRGTIHFVTAGDIRWMTELMAPRVTKRMASYHRKLGLTDDIFKKARQIVIKALSGGKKLSRPGLYSLLEKEGIETKEMRGLFILGAFAQEALICFGPREGKQATFVLLDEWAPKAKRLSREKGLAEITRRYFTGHGPATVNDMMWWSGLNMSEVKEGLKLASRELKEEVIDGKKYYLAKNPAVPKTVPDEMFLLPTYDEFLIGYKDRTAAVSEGHFTKFISAPNMYFNSVVLYKGKGIGTWRREIKKGQVLVTVRPFFKYRKKEISLLKESAEKYGRFTGLPASLSISQV